MKMDVNEATHLVWFFESVILLVSSFFFLLRVNLQRPHLLEIS